MTRAGSKGSPLRFTISFTKTSTSLEMSRAKHRVPPDERAADGRAADERDADERAADVRAADERAAPEGAADERGADGRGCGREQTQKTCVFQRLSTC